MAVTASPDPTSTPSFLGAATSHETVAKTVYASATDAVMNRAVSGDLQAENDGDGDVRHLKQEGVAHHAYALLLTACPRSAETASRKDVKDVNSTCGTDGLGA